MNLYGNRIWNDATDNRVKSIVSMTAADFDTLKDKLDTSDINYYAYSNGNNVRMAVNDKDLNWLEQLAETELSASKSDKPYSPPEKNIIGNTEYKYIPDKQYISLDSDTALKAAENIQYSGRVYPNGKTTLTVSGNDRAEVKAIQQSIINMRKQFAGTEKSNSLDKENAGKEPEKAFLRDEINVNGHTAEDLKHTIGNIDDETAAKMISAFAKSSLHGWNDKNLTNNAKINRIKKALYDILGNEEQTEKAFALIADIKYGYKVEQNEDTHTNEKISKEVTNIADDSGERLFTDISVLEEIEKSENASDNKPFWESTDVKGEQLSLFGESVQEKETYSDGLFVGNVNRFTALYDEIMRGSGFEDGKFRIKQFYDEKKPTNKELADFLKNEYGTGGHSGDEKIAYVDHDSKGIFFTLRTDEKFKFTWSEAAEMTAEIIDKGEYITQDDIDRRISNAKYTIKNTNFDSAFGYERIKLEQANKVLQEYGIEAKKSAPELNVYHGTTADFDTFKPDYRGAVWTTTDFESAKSYAAVFDNSKIKITDKTSVFEKETDDIPNDKTAQMFSEIRQGKIAEITEKPDYTEIVSDSRKKKFSNIKLAYNENTGFNLIADTDKMIYSVITVFGQNEEAVRNYLNKYVDEINLVDIISEKAEVFKPKAVEKSDEKTIVINLSGQLNNEEKIENKQEKSNDFIITDDLLGNGGAKTKFKANIDAIRTLKKIEMDNLKRAADMFKPRQATAEEKEILSKYVGWGGIAQTFDGHNKNWESECAQLKELLTDEEYSSARASTLNAFYTSPTVIDSIYEALESFGFKGGNVLDVAVA